MRERGAGFPHRASKERQDSAACLRRRLRQKNGVYDEVKALLKQADKTIIDFSGIMPNPTYAKVQEGAAIAREQHVDFILAVGGGSVIDCCKVISAQALLDEDIWEMEYGKGQFP